MTVTAPVITIDGPSGVGKGTLCKNLVKILRWHLLDSGIIYRALALTALHHQVVIDSEEELMPLAMHLNVRFVVENGQIGVMLESKDVSQSIRSEVISNIASKIAIFPQVRKILLHRQRAFRTVPGLIADGRDMGTEVFSDAPVKIFLDASSEVRAYRRMQQLQEKGFSVSFKSLLSQIKERDDRDRYRMIAPMMPAADALVLDSTYLSIDEVIAKTLAYARRILALS